MKQVVFRRGRALVEQVPAPTVGAGELLVRVSWSCVSPGTEVAGAGTTSVAGILRRLRNDREVVRKALGVLRDRGLRATGAMAQSRLTGGLAPGYSCAGIVHEVGSGVDGFKPGDAVACAGGGYASHAETVVVPKNLAVRIPSGVDLAAASTVSLGAIALQGVRRAGVGVGDKVGVIGLGFLGQLTVQLLHAAGCDVFGTDLDRDRVEQARLLGLQMAPDAADDDPVAAALRFSDGHGLDAVLLTAATKSDEPLAHAMRMTRRKGRVVVVGDVGLGARRDEMYAKELDLLMSTSYGPGRYDTSYEEAGVDYPYSYVRWTENRNMQAYLGLLATGRLRVEPLIARRVPVDEAESAYAALSAPGARPYTVLLEYPGGGDEQVTRRLPVVARAAASGRIRLAIVGAGSFARSMHIPLLRAMNDRFSVEAVVARHGATAVAVARQAGARWSGTDYNDVLADPDVDAVVIATRHDLHARMVADALRAGKDVFVEKPLALTDTELDELDELRRSLGGGSPVVMVGFNRRYSPFAQRLGELLKGRSAPFQLYYRMNAGYVPPDHWVQGPEGGGRLIGEASHLLDLFRALAGAPATDVAVTGIASGGRGVAPHDNFTLTARYADGSVCTLLYTAQGSRKVRKEYLEVFADGRAAVLDDYRHLQTYGWGRDLKMRTPDKGHRAEWQAFADLREGRRDREALWEETLEVSRLAVEADRLVRGEAG